MVLMVFVSTADVVAYLLLGRPFPGAAESIEAALSVGVAMMIANAQYRREHIAVDIFFRKFTRTKKWLAQFSGLLIGLLCMVLLSSRAWELALESFNQREAAFTLYSFPLYPWKLLYAAGFSLAALEFARQILFMALGDPNGGAEPAIGEKMETAVE
jgi:TRAP-type mannitol/chloroaromatic compound transport system permease small subunit